MLMLSHVATIDLRHRFAYFSFTRLCLRVFQRRLRRYAMLSCAFAFILRLCFC